MDAAVAVAVLFVIYQCRSRPARVHYGDESRRKNETKRGGEETHRHTVVHTHKNTHI